MNMTSSNCRRCSSDPGGTSDPGGRVSEKDGEVMDDMMVLKFVV